MDKHSFFRGCGICYVSVLLCVVLSIFRQDDRNGGSLGGCQCFWRWSTMLVGRRALYAAFMLNIICIEAELQNHPHPPHRNANPASRVLLKHKTAPAHHRRSRRPAVIVVSALKRATVQYSYACERLPIGPYSSRSYTFPAYSSIYSRARIVWYSMQRLCGCVCCFA